MANKTLTIRRPDDGHVHFRDESIMEAVVRYTGRQCARAVVMPNLVPPLVDVEKVEQYHDRILEHAPSNHKFTPLMTMYLTDATDPEEIQKGYDRDVLFAVKLYPAGATTNSDSGVTDFDKVLPTLEKMAEVGMPLLIHGEQLEYKGDEVDPFDRERVFIENNLQEIIKRVPKLRIVLEHITTKEAAQFVMRSGKNIAASVTPQHLLFDRRDLFRGGLHPHLYCLPILKANEHQLAIIDAVKNCDRVYAGTDSAPHAKHAKESSCCAAGVFSAAAAIELYAEGCERAGMLDVLESFTSERFAKYHNLSLNDEQITLEKKEWQFEEELETVDGVALVPFGYAPQEKNRHTFTWRCVKGCEE